MEGTSLKHDFIRTKFFIEENIEYKFLKVREIVSKCYRVKNLETRRDGD